MIKSIPFWGLTLFLFLSSSLHAQKEVDTHPFGKYSPFFHGMDSLDRFESFSDKISYIGMEWYNGVSENWVPSGYIRYYDTIPTTRCYLEYDSLYRLKKEENYGATSGNQLAKWEFFYFSNGVIQSVLYPFNSNQGIFDVPTTHRKKSNFLGGFPILDVVFADDINSWTPGRTYVRLDSSAVILENGAFVGLEFWEDPEYRLEENNEDWPKPEEVVKTYFSRMELITADSGIYHEYYYNIDTEDYTEFQRPAKLNEQGEIQTLWSAPPGTSQIERIDYLSWNDPLAFAFKERMHYFSGNGGATYFPLNHYILEGEEHVWKKEEEYQMVNGAWKQINSFLYEYNPLSQKQIKLVNFSNQSWIYTKEVLPLSEDENGKILREKYTREDFVGGSTPVYFEFFGHHHPSGLKEFPNSQPFLVYPNPCTETLYFPQTQGKAQLFNISGQWIQEVDLNKGALDVRKLPVGLYRLVSDEHEWVAGFVKE